MRYLLYRKVSVHIENQESSETQEDETRNTSKSRGCRLFDDLKGGGGRKGEGFFLKWGNERVK